MVGYFGYIYPVQQSIGFKIHYIRRVEMSYRSMTWHGMERLTVIIFDELTRVSMGGDGMIRR